MSSLRTDLGCLARGGRRSGAAAVVILAFAGPAEAAGSSCPGARDVLTSGAVERTAEAVGCVVNEERARRGRRLLRPQAQLAGAADRHARDMVRRDYFSHTTPEGQTFAARLRAYTRGFAWHVGETLAWGGGSRSTAETIVEAWLQSPPHRRVMLDADYRDVGIGVAAGLPLSDGQGATLTADYGVRR